MLSANIAFSQNNLGLIKTINLPDDNQGGTFLQDIIIADGYVFAYAYNRILVYDTTNNSLVGTVPLGNYGKYNPVYFHYGLWIGDFNVMAFNQSSHLLYVVSPDLKIFSIQTNSSSFTKTLLIDTPAEVVDAKTLHGRCNIKYDNAHNRLYWLLGTRTNNGSNPTGGFHVRDAYFAIYDLSNNANRFYLDFASNDNYMNMAQNFTFFESDDFFYVAKKKKIIIYQINNNNVSAIDTVKTANGKYSKLLTLEGSGPNISKKVIVLPYRFPFGDTTNYDPPFSYNVSFFVIDGVNFTCDSVISPSKRVIDGIIRNNDQNLFLCFAPDSMIQDTAHYEDDVAIYQYNQNTVKFILKNYKKTNDTTDIKYSLSQNYPMHFTQLKDNTILLGKINTIVKFDISGNNSELRRAEGSFYARAAKTNTNLYFVNLAKNGIDIFKTNDNYSHTQIKTAYPAYLITANEQYGKLYFYNTLNGKEKGIYIYNIASGAIENFINIQNTVGDVVYNNYKNEVLISVSKPDGVIVKRYRGDNNQFAGAVPISGGKRAKNMYISPDKRLYILTGMRNAQPELRIYNAETYQLIASKTITEFFTPQQGKFVNYRAGFDYDKINNVVYMVISENYAEANPYFSVDNYYHPPIGTLKSLLIKIKNDSISTVINNLNSAKKVICTYPYDNNGNQYTQLFINGKKLYLYNTVNNSLTEKQGEYNGIVYNEQDNVVYGFSNNNAGQSTGMLISFYEIDMSGNNQKIIDKKGQASAFFYNRYDGKLYFERKLDNRKLGETPLELFQINTQTTPVQITDSVSLINHGFYIEYDNYGWYNFHLVNLTTPYIDPYQNKIYLPNGAHSNVSVVSFTPDEQLTLNPAGDNNESFTWVSFPRLANNNATPVNDVLGGDNILPNTYIVNSNLENLPLGDTSSVFNYYTGVSWPDSGQDLQNIKSTLGYKLSLKYNANPNQQIKRYLHGNVLSPYATIDTIYGNGRENWIGYWLYQEQSPFDAIAADVLDELTGIKAQKWFCYKEYWGMSAQTPQWICGVAIGTNAPVLHYGDMVILKSNGNIGDFQWQMGNTQTFSEIKSATEHYQYNEEEDYTAYLIEIDTANRPLEIGAFIGSTCIGATKVLPSDTLVLIRGYDTDTTGSVYFVEYFGSQKSSKPAVREYYVKNRHQPGWQKRTINAAEKEEHYLISFKRKKTVSPVNNGGGLGLKVYPNPAQNGLTVEYTTSGEINITLEIFDVTGKKIVNLQNRLTEGIHQNIINTRHFKNGIYLLRVSTGNKTVVKRVVVNK